MLLAPEVTAGGTNMVYYVAVELLLVLPATAIVTVMVSISR